MLRTAWITGLVVCLAASSVRPMAQGLTDTAAMVSAAPHAVVGHVTKVESQFGTNAFGDHLIFSRVSIAAEEVLKGHVPSALQVTIEGGTVGDVTLEVSDVPSLHPGDRAVFLLTSGVDGTISPFDRGRGIMPLDQNERVKGQALSLEQIRRMCAGQAR